MTADEIWKLATAGDGSLDLALAKELDLPLEEFQAEKNRRKAQAAAARAKQQELNETRSTGSSRSDEDRQADDTSALIQAAKDYLDSMEEAASKDRVQEQLQGQTAFPGFEEPEELDDSASDAEAIKLKAYRAGFQMDYLRSPDDAILDWSLSGSLPGYLSKHFAHLVQKVSDELGADPAQVADKDLRTPEQERKLMELAAQEQAARIIAFFDSLYMQALSLLADVQGTLARQIEELDTTTPEAGPGSPSYIAYRVKEQAVLYFFALHDELNPTKPGALTEDQKQELQGIYYRLDDFYVEKIAEGAELKEFDSIYSALFSAFIELENPAKGQAEAIQEALANMPLLQSINPTSHAMPNNTLMNALQQKSLIESPETAKGWDLPVANQKGRRKEITAYTMVTYDPGDTGITLTGANLTEYERQVSDAIVSLWIQAEKEKLPASFTPDMIFRAMPGGSEKASASQRAAIDRTIEKLRRLHIVVDATEEMRKRGKIKPTGTFRIDTFFLSVTRAEHKIKNGGQTVIAYKVEAKPIILQYSEMTGQILTAPARYLAVEKVKTNPRTGSLTASGELMAMTPDRQSMVGYMLRRIAVMKHDRNNKTPKYSRTILFDTLFKETGTATESRTQTSRNRDFCLDVLKYWKVTGYIRGYKVQQKGKSITGVTIDL